MNAIYNRMCKLASDQNTSGITSGASDYIPFIAAINLTKREEIIDFLAGYKTMFPDTWRWSMVYALEHTNMSIRTTWKREAGDIIDINPHMQRCECELYVNKIWVNDKGEEVKLQENTERGQHQSY